jgi:hypothetical protein
MGHTKKIILKNFYISVAAKMIQRYKQKNYLKKKIFLLVSVFQLHQIVLKA